MLEMTKKKTYNPFKMWGSWVGTLIGFSSAGVKYTSVLKSVSFDNITNIVISNIIWFLSFSVIGFLIGWGIHSLVRALRK